MNKYIQDMIICLSDFSFECNAVSNARIWKEIAQVVERLAHLNTDVVNPEKLFYIRTEQMKFYMCIFYIYICMCIYLSKHTISLHSRKWKWYQRNVRIEKVACFKFYRYTKIDMRDIIMKQSDQATIWKCHPQQK